jgi:hypothetical protein
MGAQLTAGSDDGTFAAPGDLADVAIHVKN